jgi:hypothetical protein
VSEALIKHCNERLAALRTARTPWWNHWREIADYLLPRRYRWLVTANDPSRGVSLNNKILDSTGTVAHRVLGSGMMSGITSPSVQWFKLTVPDSAEEQDQSNPVTRWLAEVQQRMLRVMSESRAHGISGYQNAKQVSLMDKADWLTDWLDEHSMFPKGANDDWVDCFVHGMTYYTRPVVGNEYEEVIVGGEEITISGDLDDMDSRIW